MTPACIGGIRPGLLRRRTVRRFGGLLRGDIHPACRQGLHHPLIAGCGTTVPRSGSGRTTRPRQRVARTVPQRTWRDQGCRPRVHPQQGSDDPPDMGRVQSCFRYYICCVTVWFIAPGKLRRGNIAGERVRAPDAPLRVLAMRCREGLPARPAGLRVRAWPAGNAAPWVDQALPAGREKTLATEGATSAPAALAWGQLRPWIAGGPWESGDFLWSASKGGTSPIGAKRRIDDNRYGALPFKSESTPCPTRVYRCARSERFFGSSGIRG